MKYTILIETKEENRAKEVREDPEIRNATLPYEDATHLVCDGACPLCCLDPFQVRGDLRSVVKKDELTTYSVAYCVNCLTPIGTLKLVSETLFGLDEDLRVLHGRPRVY